MFRYTAVVAMSVVVLIGNSPGFARAEPIKFVFPNHGEKTYVVEASDNTIKSAIGELAKQTGVPSEYFLFYSASNQLFNGGVTADPQLHSNLLGRACKLDNGTEVNVYVRPIVGDHIHTLYSIWIHDGSQYKLVRPLYDAEPEHISTLEHGETQYYIHKVHNGLHTHGKGLIHVHPWTAPKGTHKTSGLGATLGHFLDTVGVTIRKPPYREELSLQFSNGIYFISKAKFKEIINNKDPEKTTKDYEGGEKYEDQVVNKDGNTWKVLFWKHYLDLQENKAPEVIDKEIFNVWMGRNLAVAVLVYGPKADVVDDASSFAATVTNVKLRSDITEVTNMKLDEMKASDMYLTMRQFDGERYPSPKDDAKYKVLDETYELGKRE